MKLIAFSKHFKEKPIEDLIAIAKANRLDGWDVCVRPGYPINPDNAADDLPRVQKQFQDNGLCIPMVTGNFDLLYCDHPTARPILAAMAKADIGFLKLGYYMFDPLKDDYWRYVDRIRWALDGWQYLSRQYGIRICYHTHSERCMGMTCGMLAHLIRGFDPKCIGAYIDPAHLVVEGEEFAFGLQIVKEYLSLVAMKDVYIHREQADGHGKAKLQWLQSGEGMVDWTTVMQDLVRVGYDGPMSVHCEFVQPEDPQFDQKVAREIAFYRDLTGKFWPLAK